MDYQLTFRDVNELTTSAVRVAKNACLAWTSIEENEEMDEIKRLRSYLDRRCL